MAEEKKSNGIFWLILLVLGGGALFGINKAFGATKKGGKPNGGTPSGDGDKTPTNKINEATKNGMPYSLDLSLIKYTVDPKYVPQGQINTGKYDDKYDIVIDTKGGIGLLKTDSDGFKFPYLYNSKGAYMTKGSDTPITIDFTKICSIHFIEPSTQATPYFHVIFFKITNNYNLPISTNITCHLELSYNGNVISTIDKDFYGIKNKKYELPILSTSSGNMNSYPNDRIFNVSKNSNGIYNLGTTLKVKQSGIYFLPFFYDNKNVAVQDAFSDFGTKPKYTGSSVDIKITGYIGISNPSNSVKYKKIDINQTVSATLDLGTNDFAFFSDIAPYIQGNPPALTPNGTQDPPIRNFPSAADENFAILDDMSARACTNSSYANQSSEGGLMELWEYCHAEEQS